MSGENPIIPEGDHEKLLGKYKKGERKLSATHSSGYFLVEKAVGGATTQGIGQSITL